MLFPKCVSLGFYTILVKRWEVIVDVGKMLVNLLFGPKVLFLLRNLEEVIILLSY